MLAHNTYTDTELLQLLKAGDKAAFCMLYKLYASALTGFAAARLASLDEARDIVHDLFVYIWDEKEKLHITSSLKSFLFAAVRYRVIDHIRKNITRRQYAAMAEQLSQQIAADPLEALVSKNLQHTLDLAVEGLPPRTKQIYQLSRNKHLAIKEIACELGLSEQTVKNQLSTALTHLRLSFSKLAIGLLWFLFY